MTETDDRTVPSTFEWRCDSLATVTVIVLVIVISATPVTAVAEPTEPLDGPTVGSPSAGPSNATPTGNATNATTLTVLTYNDIQTAVSNATKMGRLVGVLNQRRRAHENPTVVIGGGDEVSPSSLAPISRWRVPIDVLNVVDPAAEVVGNHDLDYGFDAVNNYSRASQFPWLVANVVQTDGSTIPGTKNYTIVERGGVRIGIVGLVDEAIKSKTAVDFAKHGYRVADFSEVGGRIATMLKEEKNVDVVVATAHIGVPESKELARETTHIDLIVTGDDEVAYPPRVTSGTVIVEAKARAEHVGEVNLTVTESGVSLAGGRLIEIDADAPINRTARRIVAEARSAQLARVVGRTTVALDSTFSANYHDETAWGNLITDAFRAETGADVAITNSGGIRGNFVMKPGNITYDDVYTSLPFSNTLVTKRMTGEQLRELLASQVEFARSYYGAEPKLQVSGVTYEYVPDANATRIVQDVEVNGEPLRPTATYNVTINSYMAGWSMWGYGWNMTGLPTVGTDASLYGAVVADYIESHSPVSPADTNRIRRVDLRLGTVTVPLPPGHGDRETNDGVEFGDSEGVGFGQFHVDDGFERGTVTVRANVPAVVGSVNASTVVLQNATTGSVLAESATVRHGLLFVTFDREAFRGLSSTSSDLDLYAHYNGTTYDADNYFRNAVLNVDVRVPPGLDEASGDESDDRHGPPFDDGDENETGGDDDRGGPPFRDEDETDEGASDDHGDESNDGFDDGRDAPFEEDDEESEDESEERDGVSFPHGR